jgi:hypothetical protein
MAITSKKIIDVPEPPEMYAKRLYERALEYLLAFEGLAANDLEAVSHPAYFLVCHSLELFLKSYLAACGETKHTLQRILDHKTKKIYKRCLELGLPAVDDLDKLVQRLDLMNQNHDFRYPSAWQLEVPPPPECTAILRCLESAIKSRIETRNFIASFRHTAKYRGRRTSWSD